MLEMTASCSADISLSSVDEENTAAIMSLSDIYSTNFKTDPALYFTQFESEWDIRGVLAVSKLPYEVVQVRDPFISPPKEKSYYRLRDKVI